MVQKFTIHSIYTDLKIDQLVFIKRFTSLKMQEGGLNLKSKKSYIEKQKMNNSHCLSYSSKPNKHLKTMNT
jgi:hypothetical protein